MKTITYSLEKYLLHMGTLFLVSMLFVACNKSVVDPTIPNNKLGGNEALLGAWAGTYAQIGGASYYMNLNLIEDKATGNLLASLNCQDVNNTYNILSAEGTTIVDIGVNKDSIIADIAFPIKRENKPTKNNSSVVYKIRAVFTNSVITGSMFISSSDGNTIETFFTLTKQVAKPYFGNWVLIKSESEAGSESYVAESFNIIFFPMDKIKVSCILPTWDDMGVQVNTSFQLYGTPTITNREVAATTLNISNPQRSTAGGSVEYNPIITSGRFNNSYDTLFITFERHLTYRGDQAPKVNYTLVKN